MRNRQNLIISVTIIILLIGTVFLYNMRKSETDIELNDILKSELDVDVNDFNPAELQADDFKFKDADIDPELEGIEEELENLEAEQKLEL